LKSVVLPTGLSFAVPNLGKHVLLGLFVMAVAWPSPTGQHALAQDVDQNAPALAVAASSDEPETTSLGLRLEEVKLRVRRARIGLLSMTGVFVVGTSLYVGTAARTWTGTGPDPLRVVGASLFVSGAVGMLATGIVLGVRNRQLNELEPRDERIDRARIALISATSVFVASGILWVAWASSCPLLGNQSERCKALSVGAVAMLLGGATAMIVTGALLGVRRRRFRASQQVSHATRRRIEWDLVRGRVIF
jgi:hypothetical protein